MSKLVSNVLKLAGEANAPPLVARMQKLHCRWYVCRGQQEEIERIHPPPTTSTVKIDSNNFEK